ncbi:MAG: hypothetical protein NTZ83_04465 [Candidatus Pacearchaeota archaeon]|nr:hypothetical protein [Candidatus Pacearchaeota archaeon]
MIVTIENIINAFETHKLVRKSWYDSKVDNIEEKDYELMVELIYEDGNYDNIEYEQTSERREVKKYYDELQEFKKLKSMLAYSMHYGELKKFDILKEFLSNFIENKDFDLIKLKEIANKVVPVSLSQEYWRYVSKDFLKMKKFIIK